MEHLEGLTQLESLDLRATEVGDTGLGRLKGLTRLRSLRLGSMVTDKGMDNLKGFAQLRLLELGRKVTDAGLEALRGLVNIQSLNLGGTQVTDKGLEYLKDLTELQSLDLSSTQVTDIGLSRCRGFTKLKSLNLGLTSVTDAGLPYLWGLSRLQSLELGWTRVTDAGLNHLRAFENAAVAGTASHQGDGCRHRTTRRPIPSDVPIHWRYAGYRCGREETSRGFAGLQYPALTDWALTDNQGTARDMAVYNSTGKKGVRESAGKSRHGVADERAAWKRISEPFQP